MGERVGKSQPRTAALVAVLGALVLAISVVVTALPGAVPNAEAQGCLLTTNVSTAQEFANAIECYNNLSAGSADATITFLNDIIDPDLILPTVENQAFVGGAVGAPALTVDGGGYTLTTSGTLENAALALIAEVEVVDLYIVDDDALGVASGIWVGGPVSLTRVTVTNHDVGIVVQDGLSVPRSLTVANSTIAGNLVHGVAVNDTGLTVSLTQTTVVDNGVQFGTPGIALTLPGDTGSLVLSGSLIAGNGAACSSGFTATVLEPNSVDDATCGTSVTAGLDGTYSPVLAPNGCTAPCTPTIALFAGSPAIDDNISCGGGADQRGMPRPAGACDAGAFELVQLPSGTCQGFEVTVDLNVFLGSPTDGVDVILGTPGPDVISGLDGDDIICGGGGDDVISGNSGDDLIDGGEGGDTIYAGAGDDVIYGGADNDMIFGVTGDDVIKGGEGDDTIYGEEGFDDLDGQAGVDTIWGGENADVIEGGPGDDFLYGENGWDRISASAGDDTIVGGFGNDWIWAGPGIDTLTGGPGDDLLLGFDGDDTIDAGGGRDKMNGMNGDDIIDGGDGSDQIWGGLGNDTIDAGSGFDWVWGFWGDDTINGGFGNDSLFGEGNHDIINGGPGNDLLDGSFGNDTLNGNDGNDTINGGGLNDTLNGGNGNDDLDGGFGIDECTGGPGPDTTSNCEIVTP